MITSEELDAALAEQAVTGKLLGEILVTLGAVSGPALTVALAEQWGVDVAPESGFGTGLWREIERRHRLRREGERAEAAAPPRLTVVPPPEAATSPEQADLAEPPERPVASDEPAALLAALQEENALLELSLQAAEERVRELETLNEAAADDATLELVRTARSQPELAHVLFFQDSDRYALAEAAGAPPPVGAEVALDDGVRYAVWKVGRSPLPQDARLCAFLLAVAPRGVEAVES